MQPHAIFPGTFDPPTLGHLDLIERARAIFGRVTIGVATHPTKSPALSVEARLALFEELCAGMEGVRAVAIDGLLVNACEALGATVIVRGVRHGSDLDYELSLAHTNRGMLPRIDTVFLAPSPSVAHVSSTLVRQIVALGGDYSALVPPAVARALGG